MGRPREIKTAQEEAPKRDDPTWKKTLAMQAYKDFMAIGDDESVRYARDISKQWQFVYKGKRFYEVK